MPRFAGPVEDAVGHVLADRKGTHTESCGTQKQRHKLAHCLHDEKATGSVAYASCNSDSNAASTMPPICPVCDNKTTTH
eukprot:363625-Chlamydomonas_euryale.AAC.16